MSLADQIGERSWSGTSRPNDADELAPQKIFEAESWRSRRKPGALTDLLNQQTPVGIGHEQYFADPRKDGPRVSKRTALPSTLSFLTM
jgi:hypothetical protein